MKIAYVHIRKDHIYPSIGPEYRTVANIYTRSVKTLGFQP